MKEGMRRKSIDIPRYVKERFLDFQRFASQKKKIQTRFSKYNFYIIR